jgi:hypothetical protein
MKLELRAPPIYEHFPSAVTRIVTSFPLTTFDEVQRVIAHCPLQRRWSAVWDSMRASRERSSPSLTVMTLFSSSHSSFRLLSHFNFARFASNC